MKTNHPIAVVSLSGIFPGADTVEKFWQNIINKVNSTGLIPADRWIAPENEMLGTRSQVDKACSKQAGLIHDFTFDPSGFGIDEALLEALDPLYHIILSAGRDALLKCRLTNEEKKRCGVILAAIALPTEGSSFLTREIFGSLFKNKLETALGRPSTSPNIKTLTKAQCLSAKVTALPGSILAEGLGLGGGSYTLDAACASSLYAVKLACDELQAKRADVMLAGGVSRPDCLFTQVGFTQLQALSPSGRCAPFDAGADGLVVGEGCGIIVLKRLEDALQSKDQILGIIQGIGLSNDIGGNLIAPDSEGQLRAMQRAYQMSGWSPQTIDLIECHGAGTPVGDTIEMTSLCRLWGPHGWKRGQCAIGSVKSNLGHLLTAAAAAGLIKTVLGLMHKLLPPSLNFTQPPEKSPLPDSPFRVQTEAREWEPNKNGTPRRAAINAFGFGGINAHLLIEAYETNTSPKIAVPENLTVSSQTISVAQPFEDPSPIAIVGMAASFGELPSLRDFQKCFLNGTSILKAPPKERFNGADQIFCKQFNTVFPYGAFMREIATYIGEFQIPPNEIPDLLPQHLIMLKVAANALSDAGLLAVCTQKKAELVQMGVTIGMGFDYDATDFHLRWFQHGLLQTLCDQTVLGEKPPEIQEWIETLKDACAKPLTAPRTVGALGGIIASRIAKQFNFGGPSFVVSAEEASGLKALEIAMRSLQLGETDTFLVGAVDLAGDLRHMAVAQTQFPYSKTPFTTAFDRQSNGSLPGEGACALVLKTYDRAISDGDRVYALIKGCGKANGGGILPDTGSFVETRQAYQASLAAVFKDARIPVSSVSYIETHGSGHPDQDRIEIDALDDFFAGQTSPIALGTVKPNIGNTGAAAGLASVIKTALALYQEILPPLAHFAQPVETLKESSAFHIPHFPQYWVRDRIEGPRRALVAAMAADGNCSHIILEGIDTTTLKDAKVIAQINRERKKPLGALPAGLFLFAGNGPEEILVQLKIFEDFFEKHAGSFDTMEAAAREWYRKNKASSAPQKVSAIIAGNSAELKKWLPVAKEAVANHTSMQITGPSGVVYSPDMPVFSQGELAFVFPGSGNHYVGMGRGVGKVWPEILRQMDAETERLKTQMLPACYIPWRNDWRNGWEQQAHRNLISDPINMIFGQVGHGGVMADLIKQFSIKPDAVIGYSLGETAGYFAMNVWPERGQMLKRMQASDLFTTRLAGPCLTARKVWQVPENEAVDWCVAVVDRPSDVVKKVLAEYPQAKLLIVNTPKECVIGGRKHQIQAAIDELRCNSFYLNGVVTVHCEAMHPDREGYRNLHVFPTHQPPGIRFYSCGFGRAHEVTSDSTADSIIQNAMYGFDFPKTINQAFEDGVRIFLELGPYSSCSRMINQILSDRPHLALSACNRSEEDYLTILKCMGTLICANVPVDLGFLYGEASFPLNYGDEGLEVYPSRAARKIVLPIGGKAFHVPRPPAILLKQSETQTAAKVDINEDTQKTETVDSVFDEAQTSYQEIPETAPSSDPMTDLIESFTKGNKAVAEAHRTFLEFSDDLSKAYADTFSFQTQLLQKAVLDGDLSIDDQQAEPLDSSRYPPGPSQAVPPQMPIDSPAVAYDRDLCMEFAVGAAAEVLGPEFAEVDTYKVRVRLPDEPLMLVDRIISVEGEKNSMTCGRLVTEHDVLPDAWYLDGNRAPTCISIEAGQADLFLSAYLGIDLRVKGTRAYRLLDAVATFYRGLPQPGDVIRYDIQIEKFIHQGDTYLFFFNFNGYIGDSKLITMKNGRAGFFTPEEVKNSGGIILTEDEKKPVSGKIDPDFKALVKMETASYNAEAIQAMREGDLEKAFGPLFKGVFISESIRLPHGRMKLIDRIAIMKPDGGRYGLGRIVGEADIHPNDWFLTCHFVDDRVMPGTLMYQCCEHTLRVFTQRMGWVSDKANICYEPMTGIESRLKCRGPVTPETKMVTYEVEISAMGYNPEPYVIADAHMYADGREIVMFHDMCMKLTNITRPEIEAYWQGIRDRHPQLSAEQAVSSATIKNRPFKRDEVVFNKDSLLAFALGKPSEAFGSKYEPFDSERFIARLPSPPYLFMDRITKAEPPQWALKADGWIEAELDVTENDWYFKANRIACMPFSILLEIALQPCGWLAAYMGSALKSDKPLKFRNLGGSATLQYDITPRTTTLTMRSRLTRVSEAGDMIIETFDFQVLENGRMVYEGNTNFGFFTLESLEQQVGIRGAAKVAYTPDKNELSKRSPLTIPDSAPFSPAEAECFAFDFDAEPLGQLPGKALRMIDDIDIYIKDGGPQKLGFIRGIKIVDPDEWFFKAHFFKDPVCPGSLGIESFIQLLKMIAVDRFHDCLTTHRFVHLTQVEHKWAYRGQIVPQNRRIEVEAVVTERHSAPVPMIIADGYLKVDGLYIYKMDHFGLKLIPNG